MDALIMELEAAFPCRETQIRQLYNFVGHKDELQPQAIFVYGCSSTGKSSLMQSLLKKCDIRHTIINLNECYTSKILFETVLNKFSGFKVDPGKGQPYAKCDNMMDFLFHLRKCSEQVHLDGSVLVLDKAEQLRQMDINLLPSFLRLKELCQLNICVVLISEIVFEKFYARADIVEPIKVYFSQYSKDELLTILLLDIGDARALAFSRHKEALNFSVDFYKNYLNIFLSVFHRACRDLSELRHMAKMNFVEYCRPIINKEYSMDDSMALWRHIAPILKASLEVLYLRVSMENKKNVPSQQIQKQFTFSKENLAQSLELPFYAKYLLIAAYLASYNAAKEDKRLFMKYHGKKTKTMKDVKAKNKVSELLSTQLGPKAFSLDRLLAIFYAILDDKVGFNNNLLVQVSSLVELQLLSALSDGFSLDGQKYKCIVNFEFIQTISKMVGFNIRKYLVDFSHM